jgi:hypothetical protein
MAEPNGEEDFFPLELIVNQRIKEIEGYVEKIKERIKSNPEEEYSHEQIHDAHIIINEYKYIIRHKKDILKACK